MTSTEVTELGAISLRVAALDDDVKKLRGDFEDHRTRSMNADKAATQTMAELTNKLDSHVAVEYEQYRAQDAKISAIQSAISNLAAELKEPMEVYRTTKYGAKAATVIVGLVRWLIPVFVGLLIGYNALQVKMLSDLKAQHGAQPAEGTHAQSGK